LIIISVASLVVVSVLFNEPKLLKWNDFEVVVGKAKQRFSALQRAEIAEIEHI